MMNLNTNIPQKALDYDIIVVGAGPAGTATGLYAVRSGLKTLLLDKKKFPRDKICGDAISRNSIDYLKELGLLEKVQAASHASITGAVIVAPNGKALKINLNSGEDRENIHVICQREIFDNVLLQEAKNKMEVLENCPVIDLLITNGRVFGVKCKINDSEEREFTAKVVVGADGFNSIVARKLGLYQRHPNHWLVAGRAYYRAISGLSNAIEIHFMDKILPGFLWIFPVGDNMANVGLGMQHHKLKRKKFRLHDLFQEAIESPALRERFKFARKLTDFKGWNLPTPDSSRQINGRGFLLAGDAAGLVDPFSGEGIGNALCSGKIAADVLKTACSQNDYCSNNLEEYPSRLWKALNLSEIKLHYRLQRLIQYRLLINFLVGKAVAYPAVLDWISQMAQSEEAMEKKALTSPLTYVKLLFKLK